LSARIEDLEPITRGLCRALLARWEEGMHPPLRVTHTLRSHDEQLHLWMQGRRLENGVWRVVDKKKVVTKAMPGQSPHNYGAAFDVCFQGTDPYLHQFEIENGSPDPLWEILGALGESLGLSWGGPLGARDRFTWDRPHFERPDWRAIAKGGGA